MGTLKDIGAIPDEDFGPILRGKAKELCASGQPTMAGVPIGFPMPGAGAAWGKACEYGLDQADDDDFEAMWGKPTKDLMLAIDGAVLPVNTLVAGPPVPLTDWTFPVLAFLKEFIEWLRSLGIENPFEWMFTFSAQLPDVLTEEILTDLSNCETQSFAEALAELDPANFSDVEDIAQKAEAICGFTIPSFSLDLSFSFPLPTFNFAFSFDIPFWFIQLNWNPKWPSINFIFAIFIFWLINLFTVELPSLPPIIVQAIKDGINAIIVAIITWIQEKLIIPMMEELSPLMAALGFLAIINAIFLLIIGALVVCIIAMLLGAGLISVAVAYKLGLVK